MDRILNNGQVSGTICFLGMPKAADDKFPLTVIIAIDNSYWDYATKQKVKPEKGIYVPVKFWGPKRNYLMKIISVGDLAVGDKLTCSYSLFNSVIASCNYTEICAKGVEIILGRRCRKNSNQEIETTIASLAGDEPGSDVQVAMNSMVNADSVLVDA
jgi:hypothetical protein